ncbi:MAG: hypothetical protein R3Y23_05355 [Bacillota bacterium]
MKKISLTLLMMILIIVTTFSVMACTMNNELSSEEDATDSSTTEETVTATLMLADKFTNVVFTITTETTASYLSDFMDQIVADADNEVSYEADDTGYGLYMSTFTVSGVTYGSASNQYPMMYTTITDENYLYAGYTTTIGQVTYNSCGLGMSGMPIEDGVTYVIVIEEY